MNNKNLLQKTFFRAVALAVSVLLTPLALFATPAHGAELSLVYNFGGTQSELYTAEAYWVTPIVKDILQNGSYQIIFGNYSVVVIDAASGNEIWRVNGGHDRTRPYQVTGGDVGRVNKIVVADVDGDGYDEIVVAHGNGWVSVLSRYGYMLPGWPQQIHFSDGTPVLRNVQSLYVADLDNDGTSEIIVGAATNRPESVWVFGYNGRLLPGWPQLSRDQDANHMGLRDIAGAYSYGVFMDGVTAGDITGNGIKDILVAIDCAYLIAYDIHGRLIPANPEVFGNRAWGKVALFEDYRREQSIHEESNAENHNWNQGHGFNWASTRSELFRGELGHSSVRVVDLDGDGANEVVLTAIIVDKRNDERGQVWGANDLIASRYMSVFVLNNDRTRFRGWEMSPSDRDFMGPPIFSYPRSMSLSVQSVPVIADLNGDGVNQIIINTYDGKIHAFTYNDPTKQFGNFPFVIPQRPGVIELPNEVVAVDVTGDGRKNVIFTTNTKPPSGEGQPSHKGRVFVLNHDGTLLSYTELPDGYRIFETQLPAFTNGSMAAPAVVDIDGDGNFEIIVNTKYSGIAVFRLNVDRASTPAYVPAPPPAAEPSDISVVLNGTPLTFEVPPKNVNGRIFVPLRAIFEEMGAEIEFDSHTQTVTATRGNTVVQIAIGSTAPMIDGQAFAIDEPAMIVDGRTLAPLRFVAEAFGGTVIWNESINTALIEE